MYKITAIVNPTSGAGKAGKTWTTMQAALERELGLITVVETRQAGCGCFDAAGAG